MQLKSEVRELNGYRLILDPDHHRAMNSENWKGYVYEHILVAEQSLGRHIKADEVVHHLDGNRANNRRNNLLVLERSQHAKLHFWLQAGAPMSKDMGVHGVNSGKSKATEPQYCKACGRTLQPDQDKYCSKEHAGQSRRKVARPSEKQLARDIEELSWLAIGRKYGVSDNAARKWARQYGLL